ncbi:MAG: orotidine-5'-phosphate decarboxylase [Porphyromonas sp.]|nr:orotidine-5'-phosphate decarboxylase [Porphyromonas sp.]
MTKQELFEQIKRKNSFLCIGLDTDVTKIPAHLLEEKDPVFEFNKRIIDATAHLCVAYKPNLAFYESMGSFGMKSFEETVYYIQEKYPDVFIIADAKRGDIGNTGDQYARSFFENLNIDAVTISPYMGKDSVLPTLKYPNAWTILLALTSNAGSEDFQMMQSADGEYLFERVLRISKDWGTSDQMMYVVGATKAEMLERVRRIVPEHFLLVPGVGAQGGSLEEVARYGFNAECGILVNASRSIIYADDSELFHLKAAEEAEKMRYEMASLLRKAGLVDEH